MRILFFFGTRPEAVKMAPLIRELRKYPGHFDVRICVSAQHREMLDHVLDFFEIRPDYDLNIMKPGQDLFDITAEALNGIKRIILDCRPSWLFIQGDTTSTFAGALAAFYEKIKVAHIEAGLRSFDKHAPFPEEINRVLTTHLSDMHFAPTALAGENLMKEGVPESKIFVVGNTGIDALSLCLKRISTWDAGRFGPLKGVDFNKKIILVTGHRRESFGRPFENICNALKVIARNKGVEIVYPVHLNPNVRRPVLNMLKGISNIHLTAPLDYASFVFLMSRSYLVLTDSGGIQEEAPSLGKPVLVMRDVTERKEGIAAGTAKLVGADTDRIVEEVSNLLDDREAYERMAKAVNPYGDGKASGRIREILINNIC
ncbi:MAG: UDP-N-acetylglucosamine 2-epimerase (non-hydrolyzing) [Nitrospirae bacterium]|nr:UDP-N-acetylglucosamine 2-epimerase (non-hydrolyzing) [Nitrospirota bacterium]